DELLDEALRGHGAGCTNAIDYAASCFVAYQCFRQGVAPEDPLIPSGYAHDRAITVYNFSLEVFQYAMNEKPSPERASFSRFRLAPSVVHLPAEVIRGATWPLPPREAAFFKEADAPTSGNP